MEESAEVRWDVINKFIKEFGYKSYLEIGVGKLDNYNRIVCEHKNGVDPNGRAKHKMTSDDFFINNDLHYDIIFIDGLHENEQVYKDITNSLLILNEGGTVMCHDMNPTSEAMQRVPRETRAWTGDCWKAWAKLRSERDDLEMYVVDCDFGCGVIRRGKQVLIENIYDYEDFIKNKKKYLNLVSP